MTAPASVPTSLLLTVLKGQRAAPPGVVLLADIGWPRGGLVSVNQHDGTSRCDDQAPLGAGVLKLYPEGRSLNVTWATPDGMQTHCDGALASTLGGTATLPLRALSRQRVSIRVTVPRERTTGAPAPRETGSVRFTLRVGPVHERVITDLQ